MGEIGCAFVKVHIPFFHTAHGLLAITDGIYRAIYGAAPTANTKIVHGNIHWLILSQRHIR